MPPSRLNVVLGGPISAYADCFAVFSILPYIQPAQRLHAKVKILLGTLHVIATRFDTLSNIEAQYLA